MTFFNISHHKLTQITCASVLAVFAQQALANQEAEYIDINNATAVSVVQGQMIQQSKTLKGNYQVNEPIQFVIKTNQPAYAYIFANDKYGQTRQVYPNLNDNNNYLQANRNNIVPAIQTANTQIMADRAGIETFTIITTAMPLQMADLFRVVQGQNPSASTDDFAEFLTSIGVNTGDNTGNEHANTPNIAVQRLNVSINANTNMIKVGSPTQGLEQPAISKLTHYGNTLMLTSNKQNYRNNERVYVTYGATSNTATKNYVFLGVRYANGEIKSLKSSKNDKKIHQVQFNANPNVTEVVLWESDKRIGGQYPDANASVFLNLNVR